MVIVKTESTEQRCGQVAIVGRPNVGKSTLLNRLLGKNLSIVSRKAQTTQARIIGVWTKGEVQAVCIDTPGLHKKIHRPINRTMNRVVYSALYEVDIVLFLVEAGHWTRQDDWVLSHLTTLEKPVVLVINKIDGVADTEVLLPFIAQCQERFNFSEIISLSAKTGRKCERLETLLAHALPVRAHVYDQHTITDLNERFIAAEFIREQLFDCVHEEIPYIVKVDVTALAKRKRDGLLKITADIWVDNEGQKKTVIGKQGGRLKRIGTAARLTMEAYFGCKVYLELWVKVKHS